MTGATVARSPSLVAASIMVVARIEDPADHMEDAAVEVVLREEEVLEAEVGEEEAVWEEEASHLKIGDMAHHMHLKIITLTETLIPTVPTCKVH